MSTLLEIAGLNVSYRKVPAVVDVDLQLGTGEVQVILGANGAGKTTIIKSIMGLIEISSGSITYNTGDDLRRLRTHEIHSLGVCWVPEGRQVWGTLTIFDNLQMGAFNVTDSNEMKRRLDEAFTLFPILKKRKYQLASLLSGGEQQMLAIARGLMSRPKLLLMDEPSLGLAPKVVNQVFQLVKDIRGRGISVLMVEQNARKALQVADKAYLLETGRIIESGPAGEIVSNEKVQKVFLGGTSDS